MRLATRISGKRLSNVIGKELGTLNKNYNILISPLETAQDTASVHGILCYI